MKMGRTWVVAQPLLNIIVIVVAMQFEVVLLTL